MPKDPNRKSAFHMTALDKWAFDPANNLINDIQTWGKAYLDADIFNWQAYFYHARNSVGQPIKDKAAVAGIRAGKTRGISYGFWHHGMYHPYSKHLNTSISSEQAKLVFLNMLEMAESKHLSHWIEHYEKSPYPRIQLVNGAEFLFKPMGFNAELIRGDQFDWVNIDEAGYNRSREAITALQGRLLGYNNRTHQPLEGIFTQTSSPHGKIGPLFDRWKLGDTRYAGANPEQFLSLRIRTTDNPMLDEQAIRNLMANYTDKMIRQELFGEFIDDDGTEFSPEQISWCCSESHDEVQQLYKGIEEWRNRNNKESASLRSTIGLTEDLDYYEIKPVAGRQYLASWDLGKKATSRGRNATVGQVWDITDLPWKMVAFRYQENSSYLAAMGWIEQWHDKYSSRGTKAYTVIDASGKGDVLNELIEAENRIQVEGIVYSNQLKPNLITSAKLALERDLIRFPFIRRMVDQLGIYTAYDKDIPQDIVMSFCQAMHKARELTGVMRDRSSTNDALHPVYRRQNMGYSSATSRYAERRRASIHLRSGRSS